MNLAPLVLLAAVAVAAVAGLGVGVLVTLSGRRRLQAQLDAALVDVAALRKRLDEVSDDVEDRPAQFVVTSMNERQDRPGRDLAVPEQRSAHLPAGEFATAALGESLVRLLSLGYGVRRALSAETRNRIRFEMRREVRRSRRQRRRGLRTTARTLRGRGDRVEGDAA